MYRSFAALAILWLSFLSFNVRAQELSSSNLPIIVINTHGQTIFDDPKIIAHMGIIYNGDGIMNNIQDPFNAYDGDIGIELRGNSTQYLFDKKPYGIETIIEGVESKVALLGMPPESDWILAATYLDKTFIRDPLAYEMSHRMGYWASRIIHCELVLNGEYLGIYVLQEKIKRDKNRVDIAKLTATDNSGDDLTGGYIYEVAQDGPGFDKRRRFVYPKGNVITTQQITYIKKYDDDFRTVMTSSTYADPDNGYPAWIDVDSFIDEILLQEASKNSDAYGWSSYFHKDREGKLKAGPAWDFDQAFSNSTFNDGPNYTEWIIEKPSYDSYLAENYPPFWMKLFREQKFKRRLSERWAELRANYFETESLIKFIDSTATYLNEAQQRNFERWNILGQYLWRSTPGANSRDTYQKEVDYLKTFLTNRLAWMDAELSITTAIGDHPEKSLTLSNYPNPFSETTTVTYTLGHPGFTRLEVYDLLGRKLKTITDNYQYDLETSVQFDGRSLASGVYVYRLSTTNGSTRSNKMIIKH